MKYVPPDKILEEPADFKPLHIKKNNKTIADVENVLHCLACIPDITAEKYALTQRSSS